MFASHGSLTLKVICIKQNKVDNSFKKMNEENNTGTIGHEADPLMTINAEEKDEIDKLRKVFEEDLESFLLDNILMSVQFFDNYERDISEMRDRCLEETSLESDQFACLEADSLHALVANKVTFQKKSNTNKKITDLIHPLRIFVTYKNVELANDVSSFKKSQQYTKPYYKLIVQRCEDDTKEASGYVNIIDSEVIEVKMDKNIFGSPLDHSRVVFQNPGELTIGDQKDPIHGGPISLQNENFYLAPNIRSKPYPIRSTTYKTSDKLLSPSSLPNKCFQEWEKKIMSNQTRRTGMISARQPRVIKKVLISTAFKRHFTEVFMEYLWKQMRFDTNKSEAATFHHDHIKLNDGKKIYHIFPVLEMKSCYDLDFPRYRLMKKKWIEWPTNVMKETIRSSGCSLLPMGYYEASDENNDYTLEWKIIHPKAEKYLTMHMMHTHVKCYLFALTLYKSFIETELSYIHFGPSHIINLLFLMVQKDFLSWPEYNQGKTLIKFLKTLHDTIQSKSLKYFFLHKRNMYATSPLRVLHRAQTLIMRMIQNPIPYILKGLMNLKFSEDFYPTLDYLKLYNILTVKDLQEYLYPKEVKRGKSKNKPEIPIPTVGVDTIDENKVLQVTRTELLDREILRIFTNLFIGIAQRSRQNEDYEYAMLYLTYARRLLFILVEKKISLGEIKDLSARIRIAVSRCQNYS